MTIKFKIQSKRKKSHYYKIISINYHAIQMNFQDQQTLNVFGKDTVVKATRRVDVAVAFMSTYP